MSAIYWNLLFLVFFAAFIDTEARPKKRQTIDRELLDYWYSLDPDDDSIRFIQKPYHKKSSKHIVNSSTGTSPMASQRLKTNNDKSNKTEEPTFDYEEDSVRFIDKPYPTKSSKQTVNLLPPTSTVESQHSGKNNDESKSSKQTVNSSPGTSPMEPQRLTTNNDESRSSKQTVNSSPGTSPMESQRLRTNNSESRCNEYKLALCGVATTTTTKTTAAASAATTTEASKYTYYYVVYGSPAKPKQYPHMASIGFGNNKSSIDWACGGSLISERYVLSAAHCSWTKDLGKATWVRLGELNFSSSTDDTIATDVRIEEIIIHPDYKPPSVYNDIVLFRLDEEIRFTQYIRPVCLSSEQNEMNYANVTAVGWGQTAYDEQRSPSLLDVDLSIIPINQCSKNYGKDRKKYNEGLNSSTMICAGSQVGKDTCTGDSGGPLQAKTESCLYTQIGITSFGRLCGEPNYPGVYTRVSSYIPWIESIVWN